MTDRIGKTDCPRDDERQEKWFPGRGLWAALAAIAAVDTIWLATSERLSLDPRSGGPIVLAVASLTLLGAYCRSRTEARLRRLYIPLTGVLFIVLAFTALRVLNHLTMSIPFSYADDGLARLDAMLGFNWLAYADWVASRPLVTSALQLAYSGLTPVALVVFIVLFAAGRTDRAKEFLRLVFWTGISATVIGAMFPAKAAMDRFASAKLQTIFGPDAGIYSVPYMNALRSHAPHVFNLQEMPGLVTMPSFHTACALLIAYSCRNIRLLQPLSILYAVAMIASTPIMGGHYFVDLIGGALLVIAVIYIDKRSGYIAKSAPTGLPVSRAGLTTEPQ